MYEDLSRDPFVKVFQSCSSTNRVDEEGAFEVLDDIIRLKHRWFEAYKGRRKFG